MKSKMKWGGLFLLALMFTFVIGINAFAQDEYTPINGSATDVKITKHLDLHNAAVGPEHTVTYTATYHSYTGTSTNISSPGGPVTMTMDFSGNKTNEVKPIDFSKFTFRKPGIYRFTIRESIPGGVGIRQVTGTPSQYYVDVYVENESDTEGHSKLVIETYKVYVVGGTEKQEGIVFNNEWDNYRIKIKKVVTGNQGDKTKEFNIIYSLTNFGSGNTIYARWLSGSPKVSSTTLTEEGTPVKVTGSSASVYNVQLYLKDGDSVELYGMQSNMKATVVEADASKTGYTVTGEMTTSTPVADTNDNLITIKNESVITPTGLFLNNWPYITVILVVMAACVVFIRRRKARYEYDGDL